MSVALREKRAAAKLTQEELADRLGVAPSTVAMWETGQRKPSGELMFAAARLFDCTVDELWAECFSSDSEDHTMSEMYG